MDNLSLPSTIVLGTVATSRKRALSSAGRAPDLHSGGQEFDSPSHHQHIIPSDFCNGYPEGFLFYEIFLIRQETANDIFFASL